MKNNKNRNKNSGQGGKRSSDFRPRSQGFKVEREEPKKDSKDPRVNYPNERTSKFVRNFKQDMEEGTKRGNNNDISTWNKSPEFMKSAGSLPFASITGEPFHPGSNTSEAVPGIMVLGYSHSIGSSDDPVAVNKCFEAIQSFMIHANSRDFTFDFTDTAMYILAAADVYCAIQEAQRIYGLYKSYQEQSRYLVDDLVRALGWDPISTRRNLGTMWFDLNDLIMQTRQLWIPNTIPVISRWIDMNSHVYKDADSNQAQIYAFRPLNYWQLEETAMSSGTSLMPALYPTTRTAGGVDDQYINWVPFYTIAGGSTLIRWDLFREMIQGMINKLVASGDRAAIYGDILQAYGGDKIFALKEFTSDYSVIPETNQMILAQIENVTTSGVMAKAVVQNPYGILSITPIFTTNSLNNLGPMTDSWLKDHYANPNVGEVGTPLSQILNYHGVGQPSPEWIMEATRFKTGTMTVTNSNQIIMPTLDDAGTTQPKYAGGQVNITAAQFWVPNKTSTEIVHSITIYSRKSTATGWNLTTLALPQYSDENSVFLSSTMGKLMAFDWHPFLYEIDGTVSFDEGLPISEFIDAYGDFDNYIVISNVEMAKLHSVAIFSAFGVPMTIN